MQVVSSAATVVTNFLPTVTDCVAGISVALIVEVVISIDEAAVIAWVVNDWFEATNVGVDQGMNNRLWLYHCVLVRFV